MRPIDFRSDTVTMPTKEMYVAMNEAVLGDDVYHDDPTVNELQTFAAEQLGKEAALLVPSGTFANQLALMTHCQQGNEVILGEKTHILQHEAGAAAALSGLNLRPVFPDNGSIRSDQIEPLIREDNIHFPETGLICIENAHSLGTVMPVGNMESIKELAEKHQIPVHMDGARFFNAATALNIDYKTMASYADSINICLSKGLCAPIGSLLVGNRDFINKAEYKRKLMGGGMRQAGIIAGPGLIALKQMTERLKDDHANARYMADQLDKIEGISVIRERLEINMVFFTLPENIIKPEALVKSLLSRGIKINGPEADEYRFVTHYGISKEDIDKLITLIKEIIAL